MRTGALEREDGNIFLDRVASLLEKIDYRVALTDDERDQIYRMRYDAYRHEGAIAPSFNSRLSDRYDDLDNAWVYGVFVDGQLASSIRLNVCSEAYPESPAVAAFPDALCAELAAGKIVVDPSRFVVDRRFSREYPDIRYATTRIAWLAMEYFGGDLLLATARAEHQAFYRRVFQHDVRCDPRPYHTLLKPLSLMVCDYLRHKHEVEHRFPFFRSTQFERRMLFDLSATAEWSELTEPRRAPLLRAGARLQLAE